MSSNSRKYPVSPLAPKRFPALGPIAGVRMATAASGMRYQGRDDVALFVLDNGASAAGVFTTSKAPSAPVEWCRTRLREGKGAAHALIVNAGNANAFTGRAGAQALLEVAGATARAAGCRRGDVFVGSTGVIGEPFDAGKLIAVLPQLIGNLDASAWRASAEAIRTTDTFAKGATAKAEIDGVRVTLNGIAKGSGMIAPNMATLLAYVFTDAAIPHDILQTLLRLAANESFNNITVDSDTSTSDTLLLFATGKAAHKPVTRAGDPRLRDFRDKLAQVMRDLAHQVVCDGEGASKFITITVTGAANAGAAKRIAMSIANSPLVKTAIAGEDANWGRIVMAIGKAGEAADRDGLVIRIGGLPVAREGAVDPEYAEAKVAKHMQGRNILIEADVDIGNGAATVWTCDLTHGYIDINADYRS